MYHVKSLKKVMGSEGEGFSAKLYLDDRLQGKVLYCAYGAPVVLDIAPDYHDALIAYVDTLPEFMGSFDSSIGKRATMKHTVDSFVTRLVNIQRDLVRVKRMMKNGKTLVGIDNRKMYTIAYTKMHENSFSDHQKGHPDHIVLNGLSDDEISSTLDQFYL